MLTTAGTIIQNYVSSNGTSTKYHLCLHSKTEAITNYLNFCTKATNHMLRALVYLAAFYAFLKLTIFV